MLGTADDEVAPLLGRVEEQTLLTSLLDEVATRGQALVLRGEPGIGKSRLLSETADAARARGMAVLTTTAAQSEAHLPFAGLHQLLRPVRGRAAELPMIHARRSMPPLAWRRRSRRSTTGLRWRRASRSAP